MRKEAVGQGASAPRRLPARPGAVAHPLGVAAHLVGPRPGRLDALMPHQCCHQVPQQVQARPRAEPEPPVHAAMRDGGRHRQPHPADRPPARPATAAAAAPGSARAPRSTPGNVVTATRSRNGSGWKGAAGHLVQPPAPSGPSWSTRHRNASMQFLSIAQKADPAASPGHPGSKVLPPVQVELPAHQFLPLCSAALGTAERSLVRALTPPCRH